MDMLIRILRYKWDGVSALAEYVIVAGQRPADLTSIYLGTANVADFFKCDVTDAINRITCITTI